MFTRNSCLLSVALGCFAVLRVDAAGLGQQDMEEVVVTAGQTRVLTATSAFEARQQLEKVPGAIGFVEADDFLDNFTQSIGDTLLFTPGVFADTSAQRENRISIRGSGLNATFERRGLTVLRDGVPISRASGITEFQEIDPLSIQHIEVFKGANGLRYGAASLGGAINIVTPTGAVREPGTNVRAEGGSFDTSRISLSTSGRNESLDYFGAITKLDSDGYRDHSAVDSWYGFGNVGFNLTDSIATRFYLTALEDKFELAGSLSREDALSNPRDAGSSNEAFDQDRNLEVYRLSNLTVISFDQAQLELGGWVATRDLDHAITPFVGIIDQEEDEWGVSAELSGSLAIASFASEWVLGTTYAESDNQARVFQNIFGDNGALTSEDDQESKNITFYAQLDTQLTETLHLIVGAQYVDSQRRNDNVFPDTVIDDDSGELNFDQWNGRIGLLWEVGEHVQHYVNISQGYEPPGISDITAGGADDFTALKAQKSITYEIGSRGQSQNLSWDVSVYRSEIKDELIDVDAPGFFGPTTITNTANAEGDTVHQGIELGLDVHLSQNERYQWVWRNIFTYNDFEFDGDPKYGNNSLAGVPEFVYISELRLDVSDRWYAGINLRHIASGPYVDYANTEKVPGYELVGLTAGWQVNKHLRIFGSVENIADEDYISNVSTVANFATEGNKNVFTPGEGRAAYLGVTWDF